MKIKAALVLSFSFSIGFTAAVIADDSDNLYFSPIEKLDFAIKRFCEHSPKIQRRDGLFYLPNQEKKLKENNHEMN